MITLKFKELTDRVNGYGMPVVIVEANKKPQIINRGYNVFVCTEEIDESDLQQILPLIAKIKPTEHTAYLEIKYPNGNTCCWFDLGKCPNNTRIIW